MMLKKTHLAVGLGVALYFLPYVNEKLFFIPIVLATSLLPDIDSGFSTVGKSKIARPLQWMVEHRGIIHSFTFAGLVSVIIALFFPVIALPFFLGYAFHLLLDTFTPQGIKPFWPLKFKSSGVVRTGGTVEKTIFAVVLVVDFALFVRLFI
jgi:membrane-bound metal-dependent hydrolase YbcI (DUF457 family)